MLGEMMPPSCMYGRFLHREEHVRAWRIIVIVIHQWQRKQSKARDKEGIQEEGVGSRAMSTHLGEHLIQITEAKKKKETERKKIKRGMLREHGREGKKKKLGMGRASR